MKQISTPSEKTHAIVNPAPIAKTHMVRRHKTLILFKNLFGLPIPWLTLAFAFLLPIYNWGALGVGWLACGLTILYILVDRFSNSREFSFFPIHGDLPLLTFVVSTIWGLTIVDPMDLFMLLNDLKWILFIYLFAYTLDLFPGINAQFRLYFIAGISVTILGIYQAITGQVILPWVSTDLSTNSFWPELVASQGTQDSSTEYALLFPMLLPLPLSTWLLESVRLSPQRVIALAGGLIIGTGWVLNMHFELFWIGFITSLILIYFTKKKYFLFFAGLLFITWIGLDFWEMKQTVIDYLFHSAIWPWELRQEIIEQQMQLFNQHPWLGIGYGENLSILTDIFAAKGLNTNEIGIAAPNTYFQLLVTTGGVGLALYLLFVLASLLASHRLFLDIPRTHYWHRVFALSSLGVQIAFHIAGLFVWTFGYTSLTYIYAFHVAIIAYMSKHYQKGIVPDDQAL